MKRIFCIALLFPTLVFAQTTITLDSTIQTVEQCNLVTIHYTANSDDNVSITACINDIWETPIGFAAVYIAGSLENYHGSIAVAVPPTAFGSHHCTLVIANKNDSASIVDDIDLIFCGTTGLQNTNQQSWSSIVIDNQSIAVTITNNKETSAVIYTMRGQKILQTTITTTALLPISEASGIYFLTLSQPGSTTMSYKFLIQ